MILLLVDLRLFFGRTRYLHLGHWLSGASAGNQYQRAGSRIPGPLPAYTKRRGGTNRRANHRQSGHHSQVHRSGTIHRLIYPKENAAGQRISDQKGDESRSLQTPSGGEITIFRRGGMSGLPGESLGFIPGDPGWWPGPRLEAERKIKTRILLLLVFWRKRR